VAVGEEVAPGGPETSAGRIGLVRASLIDAARLHQQLADCAETIVRVAALCWQALSAGGRVLVFGNGGSAAEAQHFAAELSGRFTRERRALAALALTTDTSALTAIANDYGFSRVFGRQIEAIGRTGDVAVALTTSGRSPNIVDGLRVAREQGLLTVAITGPDPSGVAAWADVVIAVPGTSTPRVQEAHLTVVHIVCDLVERELVNS
jgi:D-sedoheptulose 7-phosphate isomerase